MSAENPTLAECVEFARKQMRGALTPKKVRLHEQTLALTEDDVAGLIDHMARTESWLSIQNVASPSAKTNAIWIATQRWLATLRAAKGVSK
jgi:hypothetical protein